MGLISSFMKALSIYLQASRYVKSCPHADVVKQTEMCQNCYTNALPSKKKKKKINIYIYIYIYIHTHKKEDE